MSNSKLTDEAQRSGSSPDDSEMISPIKAILSDVDGVMTDGRIIYDTAGAESKQFHVRDGLAIKLWMNSGFRFGILTARNSQVVQRRGDELGVDRIMQGFEKKWPAAEEAISDWGLQPDQVCYIGDDLPDLAVMKKVGLAVAPADAAQDVREVADWVLDRNGGQGVLRELIERILRGRGRWQEHLGK